MNLISQYDLNSRITTSADKYLLIFPNKQIMEWYKRWLQRDDVIYKTECEIEHGGLVGLRYINWNYVDELQTKQIINSKFPRKDKNERHI